MVQKGFVVDCGVGESSTSGRKPNALTIENRHNFIAVASWHKTYISMALVSPTGNILFSEKQTIESDREYVQLTVSLFNHCVSMHTESNGRVLGFCLVVPSLVDEYKKEIISTVLSLHGENVLSCLRSAIPDCPIVVLNDTACYAYAELGFSELEQEVFAFININKGVGAVLVDHGRILRKANGMTTQFGHFSVDRHGPVCSCGNRGCLECLIGETALSRRAKQLGISEIFPRPDRILFSDVGGLCIAGNPIAAQFMRMLAEDMAFGLSNLISLYNPQQIIIGGTGIGLGEVFLQELNWHLGQMGYPAFVRHVQIRFSNLSKESELQGAAQYYVDKYLSFDEEMHSQVFIG